MYKIVKYNPSSKESIEISESELRKKIEELFSSYRIPYSDLNIKMTDYSHCKTIIVTYKLWELREELSSKPELLFEKRSYFLGFEIRKQMVELEALEGSFLVLLEKIEDTLKKEEKILRAYNIDIQKLNNIISFYPKVQTARIYKRDVEGSEFERK